MTSGRTRPVAAALPIVAVAALLAASLVSVGAVDAAAVPEGLLGGTVRVARVRPRLADLPDAPRRIARDEAAAARATVASCDPVRVAAQPAVPTTPRADDDAAACVALDGAGGRALLAASIASGDAVERVERRRAGRGRYEVVVHLTPRGESRLAAVGPELAALPQVLDLDGRIAGSATLAGGDTIVVASSSGAGFTRERADEIVATLREARAEQLVDVARSTGLTRRGRELLADTDATIDDKDAFKRACTGAFGEAPQTLVLGCYTGDRIHVLRVDQPNLATVMNVSLAHEMLHAGFDELSGRERARVTRRLERFMERTGDPRIVELLTEYEKTEPGARATELHSLVGTQVADLPPALERHYATYFTDRATVVDEFRAYQSVFDDLKTQYDGLHAQADDLAAQIGETDRAYSGASAEAERLYGEIQALRRQGRLAEANALVDAQNAAADEANRLATRYNALVEQYNGVVADLNTLAAALNESYNAISPEPIAPPPAE